MPGLEALLVASPILIVGVAAGFWLAAVLRLLDDAAEGIDKAVNAMTGEHS